MTGWLWYLGMLVPVIGLVQVGWQGHADRYTYLPQIGLYIAVTWAVTDLTRSWRFQRIALGAAAVLIVGALSCGAWLQTSYWRDSETLFTHALAVTSNNDVALNNLGIIFLDKGQLDDAISKLQAAIDLRPENAPAHDNLAKALLKKGQVAEAMVHYRKFLELEPANVEARNTLGTALIQQGHVREAIDQWQESLAIQPENGNAASNLAWVFATCPEDSIRDGAHAAELGERAFRISGGKIPMIYKVLAAAYAENGRFADAVETAQRGAELATIQGNPALAAELESNIALYRSGRPLRDPRITNGSSSPSTRGMKERQVADCRKHSPRVGDSGTGVRGRRAKSRVIYVLVCFGLVAITWAVFSQTLTHDFVNFDDHVYVYENPLVIRGLSTEGIIGAFTHPHARNWHPLTTISHMLDCQLYGLNAGGHHAHQVMSCIQFAVLLLFLVLKQMTRCDLARAHLSRRCLPFTRCTSNRWRG